MTSSLPPVPMPPPDSGMVIQPEAPTSKQNNWQGVVAAITGVFGLGLLGIIFGLLGLQSVRARTATNRGWALTGVIAGGFWMVAGIVVAIGVAALGWGAPSGSRFTASEDVVVGDCFMKHGDIDDESEQVEVAGVYTIDCESTHYGEVYYIGAIEGSAYPGEDEAAALSDEGCFTDAAVEGVDLDKAAELGVFYLFPTPESWSNGDRTYVCMVVSEAEDLIGSVRLAS